jgi:acyl dehydratase
MKQTRPLLPLLVTGMLSTAASADVLLQYDFENASPGVGVTSVAASVLPAGVVASSFAQLVGLGGIGVVNGATQQYNVNGIDTIDATNEYATFSVQFPYSTTIDSLTFDTAVNDYDPITVDVEWATNSGFTGATALGTSIRDRKSVV